MANTKGPDELAKPANNASKGDEIGLRIDILILQVTRETLMRLSTLLLSGAFLAIAFNWLLPLRTMPLTMPASVFICLA